MNVDSLFSVVALLEVLLAKFYCLGFVAFGVPVGVRFCRLLWSFSTVILSVVIFTLSAMKCMDKDLDKRPTATEIIETITCWLDKKVHQLMYFTRTSR
ncbi:hypothetical protein C2G38_2235183 [Gigaspora rosea]|uniref:Uncharacterized protein n=1 Tax=Gigaspora rosea TaxID=44941 RepID=A0A397TTF1_9GLOM|nr:hypothetical protein C2G38_2235183 [Gigaspora rosea]